MKNTDWNNTTTNTGWNTTSSTSNDWDNTTTTKTDWNTTTATNNDWNNTTTTNNDWNNTTISQTTGSLWDATSSSQRGTRKSEWDRSPLRRDDTKISSEEIPIEEKASSSWANVTPDVEVSTTPSSWTRRNYNSNDRHSGNEDAFYEKERSTRNIHSFSMFVGRGNYANSHNNDSTSHWRTNNNPNKVSSPAVPTKELTQDWNQKSASESARWDNTPAVTNESSGWNEQATSSTTIEPSSGWGETSIAVSTTADVNKESYGWGQPSTTATSSWTEQPKTESTDATTPVSSSTTNSSWNEPSKIIETVPLSSTKVASSWNESSKVAETTTNITTTSTTTTTTTTTTPSTITSSNWNEPSKTTATATIPISSTTDTSSGWGEPSIAVAATSGWGEQSTNATVTAASTDATPVSTETSDLNESTIPVNDPAQSSGWNSTVPEMTSDWDLPTTASTTKTTTAPHSWTDSRDISVTKDNSSTWRTPVESSGWGESTRKESTFGGWSNSRSNNSSNWNSDREANNKSKPNDQPARKGRGYLSQKMESSISTSPSPPIIVADQHETLENTTETSGSAWERFHQQGDSDSDVEIILEAEEEPEWLKHEQVLGMTAPNDGAVQLQVTHAPAPPSSTLHMPAQSPLTSNENSPRSKHVYRQYDSSSPRPESSLKHSSSNSNKNPRKPRRNFDDNWRHRDDHQYNEEQPQYNNTTNGPAMYYPAPMNGANITYVPMIPNANGNPMYAMPFPMGTSPTGQSISPHHSDDNRSTSSQQFYPSPPTVGPNGAIQLPPGYEANGMVYYGMDPSAMYPPQPFYYYAAPMPMGTGNNTNGALPPRPPPPAQQQMMYHSLPTEDSHHHKLHTSSPQQHMLLEEDDGWGPSPSIQDGEGEWSNNKKSSPLMDKSNSRYSNSNNSSPYYFYQ
jgi:hypothetical protein